jgi:hypothetical protein
VNKCAVFFSRHAETALTSWRETRRSLKRVAIKAVSLSHSESLLVVRFQNWALYMPSELTSLPHLAYL